MKTRHFAKPSVIVVVPIYKQSFEAIEQFSVDYSLSCLNRRPMCFVAPEGLPDAYYKDRYPSVGIERFPVEYFRSIDDYSRLLLREEFYQRFQSFDFILIVQPDALVLADDLDVWMAQPFDYLGAPWPEPMELTVRRDRFKDPLTRRVRATVGNGGFSLRRIPKCIGLLREFPETVGVFSSTGTNEDGFFSLLGSLSADFIIPNEVIASRFAMELKPEFYFSINGGNYPMGVHAWSLVNPGFWAPRVPPLAAVLGR